MKSRQAAQIKQNAPSPGAQQHGHHRLQVVLIKLPGSAPQIAIALLMGPQAIQALPRGKREAQPAGVCPPGFHGFIIIAGGPHAVNAFPVTDLCVPVKPVDHHRFFLQDARVFRIFPQQYAPRPVQKGQAARLPVNTNQKAPAVRQKALLRLRHPAFPGGPIHHRVALFFQKIIPHGPRHPDGAARQRGKADTHCGRRQMGRALQRE